MRNDLTDWLFAGFLFAAVVTLPLLSITCNARSAPVPRPRKTPKAERVPAPSDDLINRRSVASRFPPKEAVRAAIRRGEAYRDVVAFLSTNGLIDRRYYDSAVETEYRLKAWRRLLSEMEGGYHWDGEVGDCPLRELIGEEAYRAGVLPTLP